MIAHVPWYEFWRHGIWIHAQLTHLHAPWWAWLLRADFALGVLFWVAFIALFSSAGGKPQARRKARPKGGEKKLDRTTSAELTAAALLVLAVTVWFGYPLLILGLILLVLVPAAVADLLTQRPREARK